jgi:tetratricopeptide (TPR) repeat protein
MTVLIDYLFFYHLYEEGTKKKLRRIYAISVFLLLGLLAYGGTTPILTYVTGYGHRDFSCAERLLTESRVIFFYLYLLVVPSVGILNLNHDFSISRGLMEPPQTCLALAVIALLLVIAFAIRKKHNLLSFVVVWYLGNLVIESTILPLEIIYEHRIYLPGVLVFFLMSLAIVYFCKRIVRKEKAVVFVSLLLILYGNGTYLRNFVYGNTLSLWLDVTDKSPNMARAHANLGKVYMDLGRHPEAREAIEKALELTPDMPEALVNLGQLYIEHFGMVEEGIALIKKSQRLNPKYALGFMALGEAFFKTKDYGKAEHYYCAVVKRLNFYLPAINNLGIARIHLGKTDQAIKTFEYGIRLDPTYESFHLNLAKLYSNKERFSDAIETLNRYLQMNENSRNGRVLLERIKQKASAAKLATNEIRTSQIVEE